MRPTAGEIKKSLNQPKNIILGNWTSDTLILTFGWQEITFFKNKPFNLKSSHSLTNYPGPKYKKVSFSNPGHAINLAKKLNELFSCKEFSVVKLTAGESVPLEN